MTIYEQRLSDDLAAIRAAIDRVAKDVVSALERSVQALRTRDRDLFYEVALDDLSIDRQIRALDAMCHLFVARHLPAAGHLRFISSVLRLNIAIERAGDYAVTISRVVLQLENELPEPIIDKIAELAELSRGMLANAMRAFLEGDVELARTTKRIGKRVDRIYDEIFQSLIDDDPPRPPMQLASLHTIFGKIERFSDQAKNICEEAVFATTGELKAPRVFRILFFDERDDLLSQLAVAIAQKQFPGYGVYLSGGWSPAEACHPDLEVVGERFGLDVTRAHPKAIKVLGETPQNYHLVVALNTEIERIPHIPYHTILRRWDDIPMPAEHADETARGHQLDVMVRELTAHIRSLMERLRGPDGA